MEVIDSTQHKQQLQEYFNGAGFQRWSAIYGDGEVSRVRRTIRAGHSRMLALAETWALDRTGQISHPLDTVQVLDAGCGTGVFSLMLAEHGMQVTAVDIAPQMLAAAAERASVAGLTHRITFIAGDVEQVGGTFDLVACFDVLIHYPQPVFGQILGRLAQRTGHMLLFTYAPYEPLLAAMHWIGGFFPHAHRRTDIQMIREASVRQTLEAHGLDVQQIVPIRSGFYHVNLVQALRPDT